MIDSFDGSPAMAPSADQRCDLPGYIWEQLAKEIIRQLRTISGRRWRERWRGDLLFSSHSARCKEHRVDVQVESAGFVAGMGFENGLNLRQQQNLSP